MCWKCLLCCCCPEEHEDVGEESMLIPQPDPPVSGDHGVAQKSALKKNTKKSNNHVRFNNHIFVRYIVPYPGELEELINRSPSPPRRAPTPYIPLYFRNYDEATTGHKNTQHANMTGTCGTFQLILDMKRTLKKALETCAVEDVENMHCEPSPVNLQNFSNLCSAYAELLLATEARDPLIAAIKAEQIQQIRDGVLPGEDVEVSAAAMVEAFERDVTKKETQVGELDVLKRCAEETSETTMKCTSFTKNVADTYKEIFGNRKRVMETNKKHKTTLWSVLNKVTQVDSEMENIAEENFKCLAEYFNVTFSDEKKQKEFNVIRNKRYQQILPKIKVLCADVMEHGLIKEKEEKIIELIAQANDADNKTGKDMKLEQLQERLKLLENINKQLTSSIAQAKEKAHCQSDIIESVASTSAVAQHVTSNNSATSIASSVIKEVIILKNLEKYVEEKRDMKRYLIEDSLWQLHYLQGRCDAIMESFEDFKWDFYMENNPYIKMFLQFEHQVRVLLRRARLENMEFKLEQACGNFSEDFETISTNITSLQTMYLQAVHSLVTLDADMAGENHVSTEDTNFTVDTEEEKNQLNISDLSCSTDSDSIKYVSFSQTSGSDNVFCLQPTSSKSIRQLIPFINPEEAALDSESQLQNLEMLTLKTITSSEEKPSMKTEELEPYRCVTSREENKEPQALKSKLFPMYLSASAEMVPTPEKSAKNKISKQTLTTAKSWDCVRSNMTKEMLSVSSDVMSRLGINMNEELTFANTMIGHPPEQFKKLPARGADFCKHNDWTSPEQ